MNSTWCIDTEKSSDGVDYYAVRLAISAAAVPAEESERACEWPAIGHLQPMLLLLPMLLA